jgi:hypothetical protein
MLSFFNGKYENARSAICRELKTKSFFIRWKSGEDEIGKWLTGTANGTTTKKYYY